ncbi:Multidrug resistance abc transporter atp-binding and permease protein [Thalictrum thalictroides]|uniref:Multidrug resistance abc transporter atp-binding and permease protein n=1 Tax=Thalictrum thalictroides TaxID=46969 RepID=A0A7J6X633_THATH|nr:Multidrug resistance abc transporter atp-binding and permease protein [Thalictrum thalictroides]
MAANEWLGFRLDVLSSLTFALTLVFLVSIPQGVIDPAIAGLAVTYGLNLNARQAFVIWLFGSLQSDIIAFERMLQYTSIRSEAPLVIDTHRPDPNWPSRGEVVIRNLQVRYAQHLPLILRGVTCTFSGGMKIGIVGRTGSGKSTLIQTLFRIVEATAGQILIDDMDISMIGLHELRSRLSIIPQDPTMFEGTMRNNLDPLEEYTDEQIWEALDKCQLGDEVRRKEKRLDSPGCGGQSMQVRYAQHLPLILRGVTCTFSGGMNIGIVGRTGSGKSTLIQTLFRIVEATAGQILIDDMDISMIGLHELRSRLSIIPQDPTMFEGTMRNNLGPLEEYTDEQIWEALDKCQLGDEVRRKEKRLDSPVIENGENWSMGQRQLKTLRQHFSGSTVITIAHRVTSVLDSDKVLYLDNGQVVEYDSPNKLFENKSSFFAKLVARQVQA